MENKSGKIHKIMLGAIIKDDIATIKYIIKRSKTSNNYNLDFKLNLFELTVPDKRVELTERAKNMQLDALTFAVMKNNINICKLLLDNGANPDNFSLHKACYFNNEPIVKLLLNYNANPNIQDEYDNIPLHYVCKFNNKQIAKLLLDNKADPNIPNGYGKVPLISSYESTYFETKIDVMKLLLDYGANPTIRYNNLETTTILHDACKQCNIEIIKLLLDYGVDPNILDNNENTPLLVVTEYNFYYNNNIIKTIELLLQYGASINARNINGSTPLISYCKIYSNIIKIMEEDDEYLWDFPDIPIDIIDNHVLTIAKLLLKHGAELNSQDSEGKTALIYACKSFLKNTVNFLLDKNAKIDVKDYNGNTCLTTITKNIRSNYMTHNLEILKILLNYI